MQTQICPPPGTQLACYCYWEAVRYNQSIFLNAGTFKIFAINKLENKAGCEMKIVETQNSQNVRKGDAEGQKQPYEHWP